MAPKWDGLPMEITEFIAEYLVEMKTDETPEGGYKSQLLNFRATNTVIERKIRRVFAFRYLRCCQFRLDEPSVLALEQIAEKAGLGDRIVSLFVSRPTMHVDGHRIATLVKFLCALKVLQVRLEWSRSAPSFFYGLSMSLPCDTLTKISLSKMQIDNRDLVRMLRGQRGLQDFSLHQINVRGSFTKVYDTAKGLTELRSFNLLFVWVSKQALHFTDEDWPLSTNRSDSIMELAKLQAKLRATSHEEMRQALGKVQLIATYTSGKCCSMGLCRPEKFWSQWKRVQIPRTSTKRRKPHHKQTVRNSLGWL
jgi:hypothetical protein